MGVVGINSSIDKTKRRYQGWRNMAIDRKNTDELYFGKPIHLKHP